MYKEGITFVVPAYNTENTIQRTLDSILGQTDSRYEIVIVNDGSTDGTEYICKSYESAYPDRICYVYQDNRGLGGARNHGMRLARREYVSFLDSDDWLMAGYVEAVMTQLEKKRGRLPEIILTLPQIYDENCKEVQEWYDAALFRKIFKKEGQVVDPREDDRLFFSDVNQCRKLLRMDFVDQTCFRFREQVKWEDICPHFFLLSKCRSCMGIGNAGFYYRKGNDNQITASRGRDRLDLPIVFEELLEYMGSLNLSHMQTERMIYPVMYIFISFSMECIRMSDTNTREKLVKELSAFFQAVPGRWYRKFRKECKKHCTKKERIRYQVFQTVIRHKGFNRWLYDYLYQAAAETFIKKVICTAGRGKERYGTARKLSVQEKQS